MKIHHRIRASTRRCSTCAPNIGDVIEGQALYRAVAARVAHAAASYDLEQMPQYAPIAHAGHEAGDVFLLPISR